MLSTTCMTIRDLLATAEDGLRPSHGPEDLREPQAADLNR